MHVVSIANFILLASSVSLCAFRLNNIGVAFTGGGLPELRLSLGLPRQCGFARIQERQTGANLSRRW